MLAVVWVEVGETGCFITVTFRKPLSTGYLVTQLHYLETIYCFSAYNSALGNFDHIHSTMGAISAG